MRSAKKLNIEVGPITVNIPPPLPTHVHTVAAQQPGAGSNFKDFYQSSIKSFNKPEMQQQSLTIKAADYIKRNEGVKNTLYKDSKGFWTIGIGHLVTPEEYKNFKGKVLSDREVLNIFQKDLDKKMSLVKSHFGSAFDNFSQNLQIAILDGYFRGDLSGSPRTRKLLLSNNFKAAAKEYLNNNEYRAALASGSGVAKRMQRNAAIIAAER